MSQHAWNLHNKVSLTKGVSRNRAKFIFLKEFFSIKFFDVLLTLINNMSAAEKIQRTLKIKEDIITWWKIKTWLTRSWDLLLNDKMKINTWVFVFWWHNCQALYFRTPCSKFDIAQFQYKCRIPNQRILNIHQNNSDQLSL